MTKKFKPSYTSGIAEDIMAERLITCTGRGISFRRSDAPEVRLDFACVC